MVGRLALKVQNPRDLIQALDTGEWKTIFRRVTVFPVQARSLRPMDIIFDSVADMQNPVRSTSCCGSQVAEARNCP